ncbi:unnamed protein product [Clavelina lepadiformis]|uniref:Uncharacterized protein n=1 Tax=Clavelina lepadiformis TaxID=159417 RepID=A0ABP0F333_CLALP
MSYQKVFKTELDWNKILQSAIKLKHKERRKLIKKIKRSCKRKALAFKRDGKLHDVSQETSLSEESSVDESTSPPRKVIDYRQYFTEPPLLTGQGMKKTSNSVTLSLNREDDLKTGVQANKVNSQETCASNDSGKVSPTPQDESKEQETVRVDEEVKNAAIAKLLDQIDAEASEWRNPYEPQSVSGDVTSKKTDVSSVKAVLSTTPATSTARPCTLRTNNNRVPCQFYDKVGSCRFGDFCSRLHEKPSRTNTILLRGMFNTFAFDIMQRAKRSSQGDENDLALEHSEADLYDEFVEFSDDVLPELETYGKVVQFKVCCNRENHLRGNVYVQYQTEEDAVHAFEKLNGRFYGGRCLSCEFINIKSWKGAFCGMHFNNRVCPRGNSCNFLHVFKDRARRFYNADCDFTASERTVSKYRNTFHGKLSVSRNWDTRHPKIKRKRSPSPTDARKSRKRKKRKSVSSDLDEDLFKKEKVGNTVNTLQLRITLNANPKLD